MKFIKIKAYQTDMKTTYDLFINLHTVCAFYQSVHKTVPCVNIELLGEETYIYYVPLEELEHLKNNVISPFCGDV